MYQIERADVVMLLFVLLTVVSIGTVAATITSVESVDGGDRTIRIEPRQAGDPIGSNFSQSGSGGDPADTQSEQQVVDLSICIEFLQRPEAVLGIIAVVGLVLFLTYRRFNLASTFLVGTGLVPVVWFSYFFSTNCVTGGDGGSDGLLQGSAVVSNEGALNSTPLSPAVVASVFGIAIVASIVLLYAATSEDETFEPVEEEEPEEPDTAAFARAAGEAADRIEKANVPVDNAVYRAWLDMTNLLDIEHPDTTAPLDFAEMAIDLGLDRGDVFELTELFNEVRFGGKSPDTREDRAIEILRNIERTYQDSAEGTGGDN